MRSVAYSLWVGLCLSVWGSSQSGEPVSRHRRAQSSQCSFTFLIPQQKITGPICASSTGPEPDPQRVTRMDLSAVREAVSRQQRLVHTLRLAVEVDGSMVTDMKLLRRESRNMNSRVTQLYMQLLHEIIHKRDDTLELARLEGRLLNATAEAVRLAARYRDLELCFAALAGTVNNQSVVIAALEEQCMRIYGHPAPPAGPPLVRVVPEHVPVSSHFTNEIQREPNRAFPRSSSTSGPQGIPPPTQNAGTSVGPFRDCLQVLQAGHSTSGMYVLQPEGSEHLLQAWCEQGLGAGGWTVLQRRRDGSVNFFRNWDSYKKGFGNIDGEYWLGLEPIYNLGKQTSYQLLVELEDWAGKKVYAEYSSFHLEAESEGFRLLLGSYQGNAGDSLSAHNGKHFTTLDRDNDTFSGNCAHFHKGGWWYAACGQTNLNGVWYAGGVYRSTVQDGIFWADYGGGFYSMKSVRMMIRPIE